MKILHVWGDGDYGAMYVEDEYGVQRAYNEAKDIDGCLAIYSPDDDRYPEAYVEVLEFGEVDPKFVSFIEENFMDYDRSKGENYFVIHEEEDE
jgi:hypothetical protein